MSNWIKRLTLVTCGALLTACLGSSPAVRYYAMSSQPVPPSEKNISLGVGPFELPDYLDRPQIVVRGQNERLLINEYDRWAENLEVSMSRRIVASVSQLKTDVFAYEFIRTSSFPPDYRVFGQVTRFEADQNNNVILEVAWGIDKIELKGKDQGGKGKRTTYQRQINSSADINEVTIAMTELLDEFSADIAAAMAAELASEETATESLN